MAENNGYVTRREWDLLNNRLQTIDAKLDTIIACMGERITRQEYDHHREICAESTRRIHDRIDQINNRRIDKVVAFILTTMAGLTMALLGAFISLAIKGGL